MKNFNVTVHMPGEAAPREVELTTDATVADLVRVLNVPNPAEVVVTLTGSDQPLSDAQTLRPEHGNGSVEITVHPKAIHFTVDGEPETTTDRKLTPEQVLRIAGLDPAVYYLILLRGEKNQESYKDTPTATINMHEGMKFITGSLGPTPVS